jgi:hypothetical protein
MATIKDAYSSPMDATQVLGNPDAQNTAQRSKNISDGLMDDYKEAANPDSNKIPSSKELSGAVEVLPQPVGREIPSAGSTPTVSGVKAEREQLAIQKQAKDIEAQYGFSPEDSRAMASQMMNLYKESKKQQVAEAMAALTARQRETAAATTYANLEVRRANLDPMSKTYISDLAKIHAEALPSLTGTAYADKADKGYEAARKDYVSLQGVQQKFMTQTPEYQGKIEGAKQEAKLPYQRALEQEKDRAAQERIRLAASLKPIKEQTITQAGNQFKSETGFSPAILNAPEFNDAKEITEGMGKVRGNVVNGVFQPNPQGDTYHVVDNTGLTPKIGNIPVEIHDRYLPTATTAGRTKAKGQTITPPTGIQITPEFGTSTAPMEKQSAEPAQSAPEPKPEPAAESMRALDEQTALDFLNKAGGDVNKARDLAKQAKYKF